MTEERKEKINNVVQQAVENVCQETTDTSFFDDLSIMKTFLERKGWDDLEELKRRKSILAVCSRQEMRSVRSLLRKRLFEELKKENSFLKTTKIIEAITTINSGNDCERIQKMRNKKVRFCYAIWLQNIDKELETIAMLDNM